MTSLRSSLKRNTVCDGVGGKFRLKMKQLPFMGVLCTVMLFIVYRTTTYQHEQTEMETKMHPFDSLKESAIASGLLGDLPSGIIQASSDLELKPLWSTSRSRSKERKCSHRYLLAMPVGIKQKDNVDEIIQKFLPENFTVILFHYDGNLDGWWDLEWSKKATHIVAHNQTKWWFAKRFLHPAVVSIYDYIFLWDEDLGTENFNPRRYLEVVRKAGLEISQPALDPNSTDIHHRITIRSRTKKYHTRVYDLRGSTKCSESSEGPPCTGFVEGMAPVFSRSAWYCAWHLIQNDLVHGWGMDMNLGYCAQGDRTKKVGIVDVDYVVHMGIQTLGTGAPPQKKGAVGYLFGVLLGDYFNTNNSPSIFPTIRKQKTGVVLPMDDRMEIRRQSTWELQVFKQRWNEAVRRESWVDPFLRRRRRRWPQPMY